MQKTIKRSLALFLAILMTLGVSTAASAAAPGKPPQFSAANAAQPQALPPGVLEITTQPTDTTFVIYEEWPDLTGLVITASGGGLEAPVVVDYDTAIDDRTPATNKIIWYIDLYANYEENWTLGDNEAILEVRGYKCTTFHPVKEIDGVWYGHFEMETVFYGWTKITVTAVSRGGGNQGNRDSAMDLVMDVPAPVAVSKGYGKWFRFTAPQDGYYVFKSDGGQYGETLYNEVGGVHEVEGIDPYAQLFDAEGNWLDYDDDSLGNYNFAIYRQLKKDEVVYLFARAFGWQAAVYDVIVSRLGDTQPVLQLKSYEIKATFHDYIDFWGLLEDSGVDSWSMSYDWSYIRSSWRGHYGAKTGTTYVTIWTQDGSTAQVKVTISYSSAQWLCIIFLGGWAWMPYTNIGPFNLAGNIRSLLDYGLFHSLFSMFGDWMQTLRDWMYEISYWFWERGW